MSLKNDTELVNTREKLQRLEALCAADESETGDDEELRKMSMESFQPLIKQLKEEIAWYEAHQPVRRETARS